MLDKTGLTASKPSILPKNYHIVVYGTVQEPYTGAVLRYAITDRGLFAPQNALRGLARSGEGEGELAGRLVARCRVLAGLGVDFIQLREKDLPSDEVVHLGQAVLAAIREGGAHTRLLVNVTDDPATALSIGADGVHLTSDSRWMAFELWERFAGAGLPRPFVSVSCHGLAEVERARVAGVSAILFGPVFGKSVRGEAVQAGVGLERLAEACALAGEVPVLALGGVTETNAGVCLEAGASGIAGIRLFMLP